MFYAYNPSAAYAKALFQLLQSGSTDPSMRADSAEGNASLHKREPCPRRSLCKMDRLAISNSFSDRPPVSVDKIDLLAE